MRITMRSLITRVPPVTALRSPPLSRMTGADSPVIADSSTLAMPSITSPSPGITSPASQTTVSPTFKLPGRDSALPSVGTKPPGHGVFAHVAQGVGLGLAPALGNGLREIGEQAGEPEPERDLEIEK